MTDRLALPTGTLWLDVGGEWIDGEAKYAWNGGKLIQELANALLAARRENERLREERDVMIVCAKDAYAAWDADEDSRVGKLVAAIAGTRGIRVELDAIRDTALAAPQEEE